MLRIKMRIALLNDPLMDAFSIKYDSPEVSQIPLSNRRALCLSHPSEVAAAFYDRLEALVHCIKEGILGTYEAGFKEIEYQQRCAQHAHMLLWINPLVDLLFNPEKIPLDIQKEYQNLSIIFHQIVPLLYWKKMYKI